MSNTEKILVVDPIHPDAITLLEDSGYEVTVAPTYTTQQIQEIISEYVAIIGRTSTHIGEEILTQGTQLKCIGVHATGWNHIDIETATKNNIAVLGYPSDPNSLKDQRTEGAFVPTAEHVLLGMLAVAGNFYTATTSMKDGRWEKYNLMGTELYGKTIGIIGLGRIGSLVADRARAFGMNVIASHPNISDEEALKRGAKLVSLETLYSESDYITIHVPQKPSTINLIDATSFSKMKKGAVLINTSRAPIVNEEALIEALDTNILSAAVLDVFNGAPTVNWSLVQRENVLATPHIAGVSSESLERVSLYTARNVIEYLTSGNSIGLINSISKQ